MKKILVATPSYDGRVDVWYTNALTQTIVAGIQNDITFVPVFLSYDALIQRARNDLVGLAKDNELDGILWIDSDIEWKPEWAIELVNSGKDVIGITYPKKSLFEEDYPVKVPLDKLGDGIFPVDSLGTGFLYMSKAAYEYLWDSSEPYVSYGKDRRHIFEVIIKDGQMVSEDVRACEKLREGGFEILVDSTKTCNHVGTLKYGGDFAKFIEKLKSAGDNDTKKRNRSNRVVRQRNNRR